jgi:hypothetical protein
MILRVFVSASRDPLSGAPRTGTASAIDAPTSTIGVIFRANGRRKACQPRLVKSLASGCPASFPFPFRNGTRLRISRKLDFSRFVGVPGVIPFGDAMPVEGIGEGGIVRRRLCGRLRYKPATDSECCILMALCTLCQRWKRIAMHDACHLSPCSVLRRPRSLNFRSEPLVNRILFLASRISGGMCTVAPTKARNLKCNIT